MVHDCDDDDCGGEVCVECVGGMYGVPAMRSGHADSGELLMRCVHV